MDKLLHKGILRLTQSPFNTPILPILKPNRFPIPTRYYLASPTNTTYFSVIDLKDAFFTIPPNLDYHNLFTFTWEDPASGLAQQLTWTVLLQGFRDGLHFFSQALARDLSTLDLQPSTLFQYVDDLLLCSLTFISSQNHTVLLLNFLAQQGYHVSPSKAQLSQPQVKYLGVLLTSTSMTVT
jgi:hypothetical protein